MALYVNYNVFLRNKEIDLFIVRIVTMKRERLSLKTFLLVSGRIIVLQFPRMHMNGYILIA